MEINLKGFLCHIDGRGYEEPTLEEPSKNGPFFSWCIVCVILAFLRKICEYLLGRNTVHLYIFHTYHLKLLRMNQIK